MSAHFIFIILLKIHICNLFVCYTFIEIKIIFKGEELLYEGRVLAGRSRKALERGQASRRLPEAGVWGGPVVTVPVRSLSQSLSSCLWATEPPL